jgi:hypothetical protein
MITQDELKDNLKYNPETGKFIWLKTKIGGGAVKGKIAGTKYNGEIRIGINRRPYLAHRLAWLYVHGYWPNTMLHINLDRHDNRLVNLKETDKKINARIKY